jgi:AAA domain
VTAPNLDGIIIGSDGEQVDLHELAVLDELRKLRVRQDARRRFDAENRPTLVLPPIKRLDELLAEPDTEQQYRIDQVALADARIMLNAQWKAGKTTLRDNCIRSLADREPFLGRFTVNTPAQHLVLIDNELSEDMVRRWLREQNIANTTAVHVITLRGKVSTFNLLDDQVRAEWAERLGALGCDYLVLDCLRPVLDALGLDERSDAGKFLVAYDALLCDAGISDSLVVQHMGHSNERARGDSRLQDWPDAIWSIVRETDNPDSPRFFSAYGRDVNVAEGRLSFDKATRRLAYAGGSRRDSETEAALVDVVKLLATTREPMSGRGIEDGLSGTDHKRGAIRKAIKKSAADELVTETTGPKNAKLHTIAYPCAECGMPVASKRERHQVCPPSDAQEGVLWL